MKKFIFLISVFLLSSFFVLGLFVSRKLISETKFASLVELSFINVREKKPVVLKFFEEIREELILVESDFLEINLSEMKTKVYQKGVLKKEVPILTRGNPQVWGGTAAGLYKVKAKYRSSFSVAAEVYMPWAIHFYGKYYLHGEPYYPSGIPLISSVSGGCIRLLNKNAKSIFQLAEIDMPVLVIDQLQDDYEYPKEELNELPEISAQSYLVADLESGFVFAEKNSKEELPIASLTKLMTAIVVTENIDLEKWVTVREEMLDAYGSTEGLETGLRFRIVELLYPLLIESSNDAAEVLTGFLGSEKTIKLMNEKAKAISMNNTKFVCPSGYAPGNISTVQDLFYLARYILNNRPLILKISKGEIVPSYGPIDFDVESLWNKNIFIYDQTFVGGKTGLIETSKDTALFIFRFSVEKGGERNIAIILLGSQNEERDTQKIYIWLQKNYFK